MDENELDVQSEPVNENANSDVAAASAAQSRNSESDTAPKTPLSPRSSDDMLKAAQIETPQRCMQECLREAYNVTTIRTFCISYFYESVHKQITSGSDFDEIINKITDYCQEHRVMERFWQAIRQDRPNWYTEYYPRWQKAIEPVRKIEPVNTSEFTYQPDNRSEKVENIENNPLVQNTSELTRWFFKELRQNERSLLLTAALFEGMSRQKMLQVDIQLNEVFSDKK